jgi:hypothetical protein
MVYVVFFPPCVGGGGRRCKLHRLGPTEYLLPEDGDRIQSPLCFKYQKPAQKLVSGNTVILLICHRHKCLNLK